MDGKYYSPSIFELIACDRLKVGLRDALRYLLDNINQTDTFKNLPAIFRRSDETVLLLDLLIEYNYLKSYNASYAENLYNLLRLERSSDEPAIPIRQVLPSLVGLTFVPYVQRKLDKYFEELYYKETRSKNELRSIRIYRLLSKSATFLNLLCLIRYSSNQASYHSLMDYLVGTCLKGKLEMQEESNDTPGNISKQIADLLGRLLTVGSYTIQFLDYWNTHSNSSPLFNASLPIPKPPNKNDYMYTKGNADVKADDLVHERSSKLCLICLHVRQNECALSNTGYVFCYKCIHRYVTQKQRCPVTGHPAKVDNIIKLYSSVTGSGGATPAINISGGVGSGVSGNPELATTTS